MKEPKKAYYNDKLLDHACPMTVRGTGREFVSNLSRISVKSNLRVILRSNTLERLRLYARTQIKNPQILILEVYLSPTKFSTNFIISHLRITFCCIHLFHPIRLRRTVGFVTDFRVEVQVLHSEAYFQSKDIKHSSKRPSSQKNSRRYRNRLCKVRHWRSCFSRLPSRHYLQDRN